MGISRSGTVIKLEDKVERCCDGVWEDATSVNKQMKRTEDGAMTIRKGRLEKSVLGEGVVRLKRSMKNTSWEKVVEGLDERDSPVNASFVCLLW